LERQIRRAFDTFVCDFIKDESDEYWLTQIKGYKLTDAYLYRPLRLSRRQQRKLLHTKSLYTYSGGSNNQAIVVASKKKNRDRGNSIISAMSGDSSTLDVGSSNIRNSMPKKLDSSNILRCVKCRFCDLDFELSQLPYKMTLKMIKDTQRRLQLRISRPRFVALFGDKKKKKDANRRSSSDRTNLYRAYDVCKECYKLYQSDVKLQVLESKFSTALGIPVLKESNVGDVMEQIYAARDMMRVTERRNMKYRGDSPRKGSNLKNNISPVKKRNSLSRASFSKARLLEEAYRNSYSRVYQKHIDHDPLQAALEASQTQRPTPPELTMFRLLLVFNEIHDFPISFATRLRERQRMSRNGLSTNGAVAEEFYLVYEALGQKVAIPIDFTDFLNVHDKIEREREGRKSADLDGKYGDLDDDDNINGDNENNVPIKLHRARMHYFFAAQHSPGNINLDSSRHGLDVYIEDIDDICISLCRGIRPTANDKNNALNSSINSNSGPKSSGSIEAFPTILKEYGIAKLSIRQFKSKFVNKHDCFASFGLGAGGMCSLRATIGIDHTREQLDSRVLDSETTIKFENGVYIPSPSFSSPDPLPDEWLEILGKVQHLQYEITNKHEKEHQQEVIKKQQENTIDKLWCLQLEIHAVNYLCDVLENGYFDVDSKYYATYTLFNQKYQTEDRKPTFDPDELTRPLLAFENTQKLWAKGSVYDMKNYFNKIAKPMEINIYKRRTNPYISILSKLKRAYNEIDFDMHGSVVLKELGHGIIFNPRVVEHLLTPAQALERRQFIDDAALKNKLKSISVLTQSARGSRFKLSNTSGTPPSPRKRSLSGPKKTKRKDSEDLGSDNKGEDYNENEVFFRWPRNEFCDLNTYVEGMVVIGEIMLRNFVAKGRATNSILHEAISRDEWVQFMCKTVQLRHIYEAAIFYCGGVKNVTGVQKIKAARLMASFSRLQAPTKEEEVAEDNQDKTGLLSNNVGKEGNSHESAIDLPPVPPNAKFETFAHELHHHCGKEQKLESLAYESCVWALTEGADKCNLIAASNPNVRNELLNEYLEGLKALPDYKPVTWKKFLRACLTKIFQKSRFEESVDSTLDQQSSIFENNVENQDILMGTATVNLDDLGRKNQMDSTYDIEMKEESWVHTYPPYLSLSAFVLKIDSDEMKRSNGISKDDDSDFDDESMFIF
jgi:hypothetical protein